MDTSVTASTTPYSSIASRHSISFGHETDVAEGGKGLFGYNEDRVAPSGVENIEEDGAWNKVVGEGRQLMLDGQMGLGVEVTVEYHPVGKGQDVSA